MLQEISAFAEGPTFLHQLSPLYQRECDWNCDCPERV